MTNMHLRPPAVAGLFYAEDARQLRADINSMLAAVENRGPAPKALIVPHAGYIYSGPVAASAYASLAPLRDRIHRVVLLGPAHRVALRGLASSSAQVFLTPLGGVPLDRPIIEQLNRLPQVHELDRAHEEEHSLEVQLPFLQCVLASFTLVPLVVGDATPSEINAVLDAVWGGDETLIVISSDLSHYHDYQTAQAMDRATTQSILNLQVDALG